MRNFLFLILTLNIFSSLSQNTINRKGKLYISWGYNRSTFGLSDIRLTGPGYDYTIEKVKAIDRPSPFDPSVYFSITKISIPQFNFRTGFFLNNHFSISLGYDHMKYVLVQDQLVAMWGQIDSSASENYAGTYSGEKQIIHQDLLIYEHTDGLNYISAEAEYFDSFYETKKGKIVIDFFGSFGLGIVLPKTRAIMFNNRGNDAFHLSGIGISGALGSRIYFFKHFYIHVGGKTGYLFMPNIATNALEVDRASQTINFFEGYFQLGGQFNILRN